jgi:hypothetical protein
VGAPEKNDLLGALLDGVSVAGALSCPMHESRQQETDVT